MSLSIAHSDFLFQERCYFAGWRPTRAVFVLLRTINVQRAGKEGKGVVEVHMYKLTSGVRVPLSDHVGTKQLMSQESNKWRCCKAR